MPHEPSPPEQSSTEESEPTAGSVPTRGPSRRQVIAGAGVGLGLAATGALAGAAGSAVLGAAPAGSTRGPSGDGTDDVVVAHVVDASTGDIDVYVGESQVRIRDRAVAARLRSAT
jgi:hypothetical protein